MEPERSDFAGLYLFGKSLIYSESTFAPMIAAFKMSILLHVYNRTGPDGTRNISDSQRKCTKLAQRKKITPKGSLRLDIC